MPVVWLIVIISLSCWFNDAVAEAPLEDIVWLRIEGNKSQTDDDLNMYTLGGFGIGNNKVGYFDIAYLEHNTGEGLALDIGAGVMFGVERLTGYLSLGFLVGYDWEQKGAIRALYPEVGAILQLTQSIALTVSRKRYVGWQGEDPNVIMFGIALSEGSKK